MNYEKIDEISKRFGDVDILDIQILSYIDRFNGCSIFEVSEFCIKDYKLIADKIDTMSRRRLHRRGYCLIEKQQNLASKNKKSLSLTSSGIWLLDCICE